MIIKRRKIYPSRSISIFFGECSCNPIFSNYIAPLLSCDKKPTNVGNKYNLRFAKCLHCTFLAPARSPVSHFVICLFVSLCVFKPELWHFLAMNVPWMCHECVMNVSVVSHQSSVISRQSSVVSRQSSLVSWQLSVISRQSTVVNHQLSVVSHQSLLSLSLSDAEWCWMMLND